MISNCRGWMIQRSCRSKSVWSSVNSSWHMQITASVSPLHGLDDSKKLSLKKRLEFRELIMAHADYGIGIASAEEIDKYNIYQAAKIAMKRALENLTEKPDHLLIDAMTLDTGIEQTSIIKGDANSNSIAAASVLAKTTRDMMMDSYSKEFPGYDFENNKGYGTRKHLDGI